MEAYFKIPYQFEKLDLIAIPTFGIAMENPGAVTFDEYLLLIDEKNASANQLESFAVTEVMNWVIDGLEN